MHMQTLGYHGKMCLKYVISNNTSYQIFLKSLSADDTNRFKVKWYEHQAPHLRLIIV